MDLVQLFISLVPLAIYHLYVLDRFKQHDGVIRSEALAIAVLSIELMLKLGDGISYINLIARY